MKDPGILIERVIRDLIALGQIRPDLMTQAILAELSHHGIALQHIAPPTAHSLVDSPDLDQRPRPRRSGRRGGS